MSIPLIERLKTATTALPRALRDGWNEASGPALPRGANTEIGRLFRADPALLLHARAGFAVVFSAKSACTSTAIWFFKQLGHLDAACDYHGWPHRYRMDVYYRSRVYANAFCGDLAKMRIVRVVRDPYSRAVSSFRHALGHGYADRAIARALRRRDIKENGFSFAEFLDFLERIDLAACDVHFRVQRHPVEDRLPVHHLINVSTEDLFTRLNEVEAELRLPHTDFASIPWFKNTNEIRLARGTIEDATNVDTRRFTAQAAREGPWAPYDAFLTPAARDRITRLYAVDIETYIAPNKSAGAVRRPSGIAAASPTCPPDQCPIRGLP